MKNVQQMLSNALRRSNRTNGRPKGLRRFSAIIGPIVALALVIALMERSRDATEAAADLPRAFYVSYVDDARDDRGRTNYQRLVSALRELNPGSAPSMAVDFVQVVVGDPRSIGDALQELVREKPAAIIATSDDVLQAAKAATQSIPILFMSYADPVRTGEVRSMAAPGVNRTGFTFHVPMLQKAIELLVDAYPASRHVGVLIDTLAAQQRDYLAEVQEARNGLGVQIDVFIVDDHASLAGVLDDARTRSIDAWYITAGAALWYDKEAVIKTMAETSKPVLYDRVAFAREGAPMAYEARIADPFRIWANQLLMISEGVDVTTIPVERPSRFDLAINIDAIAAHASLRPSKSVIRRANVVVSRR